MDDGGWQAPGHEGGTRPEPEPYAPAPAAGPAPGDPYAAPGPLPTAPGPTSGPVAPVVGVAPSGAAFSTTDRHRERVLGGQGYDTPAYRNDSVAVASMVLGVLGVLVPGLCLAAVACGHLARRRLRDSYEGGRGLAVAGLALGYGMTAVWLGLALLFVSTRALL